MSAKHRFVAVTMILCLAALLATGCRTGRNKRGGDFGPVTFDELQGDYALEPWGDDPGRIVTGVHLENVLFDFDSARIRPSERPKIEAAAEYLRRNAGTRVVVEGHCDERGSKEYNMALGERRALATRAYLIGLNIDRARVMTKSYGEESPEHLGHNEQAWRQNRRAAFVVYR